MNDDTGEQHICEPKDPEPAHVSAPPGPRSYTLGELQVAALRLLAKRKLHQLRMAVKP